MATGLNDHLVFDNPGEAARIVVVEDEPALAELVCTILKHCGYSVEKCLDPTDFEVVADFALPDLVITDLCMPERTGMDILRVVADRYPETGALVLTGVSEVSNAVEAMQLGALDYIVKPVSAQVLTSVVTDALARHRQALGRQREIERTIAAQQNALAELQQLLWRGSESTLTALSTALDARERATAGHSERVSRYATELARRAGIGESDLYAIRVGALLHDIGKIGIPDSILLKNDQLSTQEWAIMREHPKLGFQILSSVEQFRDAAQLVLLHHERWDGNGYPNGLAGEEIPLGARIFAIVDAYDAITSDRPYRRKSTVGAALREIEAGAGTQFDPRLVKLFIEKPPSR